MTKTAEGAGGMGRLVKSVLVMLLVVVALSIVVSIRYVQRETFWSKAHHTLREAGQQAVLTIASTEVQRLSAEVTQLEAEVEGLRRKMETPCAVSTVNVNITFAASFLTVPDDRTDPPLSTQMVSEFHDVCLKSHGGDRFQNPSPRDSEPKKLDVGWGDLGAGPAFVVLDLCKMGHQPKDAALLHALIQEKGKSAGAPVVLFGNRCMTRTKAHRAKGAWHVLKDWFDVSIGINTNIDEAEKTRVTYIEDFPKGVCVKTLYRRPHLEPFRWMRTRAQAHIFRKDFLKHFNVSIPQRDFVQITIVRRGVERHFSEDAVHKAIKGACGRCVVTYVQFDGDANPAGVGEDATRMKDYRRQLVVLASTDVLVAAHGAALSSIVALPRGAAVIELFPHNFRYHMYAELAHLFSLLYLPFESLEPYKNDRAYCGSCKHHDYTPIVHPYYANGLKNCKGHCTPPCKKCDIKFEFEKWLPAVCDEKGVGVFKVDVL